MTLNHLLTLTGPTAVASLPQPALLELQTALAALGYPVGPLDGQWGPRTRSAWGEFKEDFDQGDPVQIGPGSVKLLQAALERDSRHDFSTPDGTRAAIAAECRRQGIGLAAQIAYVWATVEWETARTWKPVKEAYWKDEVWRQRNLRYSPFYGRGYVQLTWKRNYEKYSAILGVDLVAKPDLAMEPETALFILVHGFKTGAFTGRKLEDYVNAQRTDFRNARRVINGVDEAATIEKLARKWLATL